MLETPLRIVICEDDEQLAALVADILERDGRFIVVGRAVDGDEACGSSSEHDPDVVLMDIGLPGQDGIDATRAIHAARRRTTRRHLHGVGRVRRHRPRRRGGSCRLSAQERADVAGST